MSRLLSPSVCLAVQWSLGLYLVLGQDLGSRHGLCLLEQVVAVHVHPHAAAHTYTTDRGSTEAQQGGTTGNWNYSLRYLGQNLHDDEGQQRHEASDGKHVHQDHHCRAHRKMYDMMDH